MAQNRITQYFVDSYQELMKVSWPTKNRAVNVCILVVSFVLISAAFMATIDALFHKGYLYLLSLGQA